MIPPGFQDLRPNDDPAAARNRAAPDEETPVVLTGVRMDFWSIFVLVLMVSISQAIIGGLALLVLHRFGVV